jgi:hypothetical protein
MRMSDAFSSGMDSVGTRHADGSSAYGSSAGAASASASVRNNDAGTVMADIAAKNIALVDSNGMASAPVKGRLTATRISRLRPE